MLLALGLNPNGIAQQPPQDPVPKHYPWDTRAAKCLTGEAPIWRCRFENWPDYSTTHARVGQLLPGGGQEADIELLSRAEADVGMSTQRFTTGEYQFDAWFQAFFHYIVPQPGRYRKVLEEWSVKYPESPYAPLFLALDRFGSGWAARGFGFSNTVSPEAWKIYRQKLAEADLMLDGAPANTKRLATWYLVKLLIANQSGKPRADTAVLFEKSILAWPHYRRLYLVMIEDSLPKWGGSFDQVERIAQRAYENNRAIDGAAEYAAIYGNLISGENSNTLQDSSIDWNLAKQGIRDYETRNPAADDGNDFIFALMACQIRDRAEARRLYERIDGKRAAAGKKQDTEAMSTDACRAFAMGT